MKKSGRVRIRGKWWQIEIKKLPPMKRDGVWGATRGLCHYEKRTIFLNPQYDMETTLLHEVTHACQPDLDEPTVEQIEDALVNALATYNRLNGNSNK